MDTISKVPTTPPVPADTTAVSPIPIPEAIKKSPLQILVSLLQAQKKLLALVFIIGAMVTLGVFVYLAKEEETVVRQFTNVYSFVPEKISKSAAIPIFLPEGVHDDTARDGISFSPEIAGSWIDETQDGFLSFKPNEPLTEGIYYAVNMEAAGVEMSGDFLVDEDPAILAIFPANGSETHEDTEISILFNRPMVPLTSLAELDEMTIPVSIYPATEGTWKWTSTRNLQFVPKTTLFPASTYTVEVKDGLISLDGLSVEPFTHTFETRPLRIEYMTENEIGYRSPLVIHFNQPINVKETVRAIRVTNMEGRNIDIIGEYGTRTFYDTEKREEVTEEDTSTLFVYQKKDNQGREGLWDFDGVYEVSIGGAVPYSGMHPLAGEYTATLYVASIFDSFSFDHSYQDVFDPADTLTISFSEDVNVDASRITAKGLHDIEYLEKCKGDERGENIRTDSGCEKVPDMSKVALTFDKNAFQKSETFSVEFEKLITSDGFAAIKTPFTYTLTTYPEFRILRTVPANGATDAALTGMKVCSNTPLGKPADSEYVDAYVQTSGYLIAGKFQDSWRTLKGEEECGPGEFITDLGYGILPETNYAVKLALTDAFGQTASTDVAFTTMAPTEIYTRFQNLQQQYNVTTPEVTKFTYASENLESVNLHICRLEPEEFLRRVHSQSGSQMPPRSDGCTQVISESLMLTDKYWRQNNFQIDLKNYFADVRGHYIITFSAPNMVTEDYQYDSESGQSVIIKKPRYDRTYVSVTNLSVVKKEVVNNEGEYSWWYADDENARGITPATTKRLAAAKNLYYVAHSRTLAPLAGASVTQFAGTAEQESWDSATDTWVTTPGTFTRGESGVSQPDGIVRIPVHTGDLLGAVIRSGQDTAIVSDWADSLQEYGSARDASKTYVYTDRPIYRPGHTVFVRGIDRVGYDGTYEISQEKGVPLTIYDATGNVVYNTKLPVSMYGTFDTSFTLPLDAPLGTYVINAYNNSFWFDVEEYVPAAFELVSAFSKDEYRNGDTVQLDVQADYYFGVPLDGGDVTYSVTAQDYYFDKYTDEYFNFGGSWYYCYSCGYGDTYLFDKEVKLDSKGHVRIEDAFDMAEYFDSLEDEGSKLITYSVGVKDSNGRTVGQTQSFVLHKSDMYIGVKTDDYFTQKGVPVSFRVKTVDTEGVPRAAKDITRTVYKVTWETFKRQEVDGGFYYRSERKLEEVSKESIATDKDGNWSGSFMPPGEGQYEIQISRTDDRGTKLVVKSNAYVYGDQAVYVPPNNNYELDLEAELTSLRVGDTASVLIKSPYPRAKALITTERGEVFDYTIVDVIGGLYVHEFKITEQYAPNVNVSVTLMSDMPEVKYGYLEFTVDTDAHVLNVDVTANKEHYLPGEEVVLKVKTLDAHGKPVSAEVSLAVADLSVLALKGNPKKSPLTFFYDGFPLAVTTASNIKNILYEVDVPLGTKGGGGADPDDLASKKRGLFKDTAYWSASVVTNADGTAEVRFTLPDNLTTWQVESVGVTTDTKLGTDYIEFGTKKDLMAVPLKPRFIVPGDAFSLGAKVFNQTANDADIEVALKSDTLEFTDESNKKISIKAGESKTVYFDVVAPEGKRAGVHTFNFTASFGSYVDSVDQVIPITPDLTYETVATANMTSDASATEFIYVPDEVISDKGGLTINANATLAVFMQDALRYMATYPYGCSEQLASSVSVITKLKRALDVPGIEGELTEIEFDGVMYALGEVVESGLSQLYAAQNGDGGFSYYKGLEPSLNLSIHVLGALIEAKEAGFEVSGDVLDRARAYVESETVRVYTKTPSLNKETVIHAEYTLQRMMPGAETELSYIIKQNILSDKQFMNEHITSGTLALLAMLTMNEAYNQSVKDSVYESLKNRIAIDGRGAYLKKVGITTYYNYQTSVQDTALLLAAIVSHKDDTRLNGDILRWLLASRDSQGVWGSTHNTFAVVSAMVDYLSWQKETEARFTLKGFLDGVEKFAHAFLPENVMQTFTHFIPMSELKKNVMMKFSFERTDDTGNSKNLYYDMALRYFIPAAELPPRDEGITITRGLYAITDTDEATPLTEAAVGDVLKGKLTITIPESYKHVTIEDFIPAGLEIVNRNLTTEVLPFDEYGSENNDYDNYDDYFMSTAGPSSMFDRAFDFVASAFSDSNAAQLYEGRYSWGEYEASDIGTRLLYPTHVESHDDRIFIYKELIGSGVYEYEYYVRALVPGTFTQLPAKAEEQFFPEVFGRTSGEAFTVTPD